MKRKGILIYIIALSSLFVCNGMNAQNVEQAVKEFTPLTDEQYKASPFYQGTSVGIDIWGLGAKVFGSDFATSYVFVQANLKNRYLPIVEIGYGSTNTTNEDTNIFYKTSAPFFKIGMDYNILYRKPYLPGYLYAGFRVGHSSFSYDLNAPSLTDPVWGNTTVPFTFNDVKSNMTWGEFVFGLKTRVFSRFAMGWSARYQFRLNVKKAENSEPWYVPGFGENKSSKFAITYNLIYDLPF